MNARLAGCSLLRNEALQMAEEEMERARVLRHLARSAEQEDSSIMI
jgi:hypothetical protein